MPRPKKSKPAGTSTSSGRGRPRKDRGPDLPLPAPYAAFAKRLARVLEVEGLTSHALAIRCGVKPTNMAQYLKGQVQPGFDLLRRISENLRGLSLDWLLFGEVFGEGGDEPRYRGDTRPRAELEAEIAAHIAREIGYAELPAGEISCLHDSFLVRTQPHDIDGAEALREMTERARADRDEIVRRCQRIERLLQASDPLRSDRRETIARAVNELSLVAGDPTATDVIELAQKMGRILHDVLSAPDPFDVTRQILAEQLTDAARVDRPRSKVVLPSFRQPPRPRDTASSSR